MGQPVVHFEVISKDPDGLRKFFEEFTPIDPNPRRNATIHAPGRQLRNTSTPRIRSDAS